MATAICAGCGVATAKPPSTGPAIGSAAIAAASQSAGPARNRSGLDGRLSPISAYAMAVSSGRATRVA